MEEKISIVVPVYNAEKFLAGTVDCVRKQSFPDWELLLVDDASKDGSFALMQRLAAEEERIRAIEVEGDLHSAAAARNTGLRHATGRYLAFLDADDVWMPDKLEKELAFLKEKNAAFVFTGYEFGDENAAPTGHVVSVPDTITLKEAYYNTTIFTSTVLIDLEKTGREAVTMPYMASEDTATWWQILKIVPCAYGLDENLAIYRRSQGTLSSNKLVGIKRIWNLYRKAAGLSAAHSLLLMPRWALRAVLRRLKKEK